MNTKTITLEIKEFLHFRAVAEYRRIKFDCIIKFKKAIITALVSDLETIGY